MGKYTTKQYIIMRADLEMPVGKVAAQAGHASVLALLDGSEMNDETITLKYSNNEALKEWINGDYAKVCLAVNSEEELKQCFAIARKNNLHCSYIVDNGTTVFDDQLTPTCVGIGPCKSEVIEPLFKHLKLYK